MHLFVSLCCTCFLFYFMIYCSCLYSYCFLLLCVFFVGGTNIGILPSVFHL